MLNSFPIVLLDGVSLILGGVFYLLVARFYGPYYALGAALIASSRTLHTWGHPHGIILFSLEAFAAGWLCRRGVSLWAADLLYWLCCGVPLRIFFFSLGVNQLGGWAILVKQPANGLLDVALVEFLLLAVPFERLLVRPRAGPARPFRASLFSAFLLVGTLPLVFLNIVGARNESAQSRKEAEDHLRQLALAVETMTSQRIARNTDAIAALAEAIRHKADFSPAALNRWLAQTQRLYTGFLTVIVADRHGAVVGSCPQPARADAPLAGHSVADRDYFRVVMATGRSYVSEAFLEPHLGSQPIIAVSAPVLRPDGRIFGVLEGALRLDRFGTFRDAQHAGSQQVILLDQRDHMISASPAAGYAALTDLSAAPFVKLSRQSAGCKAFRYEANGTAYLAYAAPLSRGWLVIARIPLALVQAAARREYVRTAEWALIAIALSLFLADLASRRITRPLEELVDGFRQYAPGAEHRGANLRAEAPVEAHALVGEFARLAGRLDESYSDLRRAKDESYELNQRLQSVLEGLDRQVRERTAELAEASALLLALVDCSPIAIIVVSRDFTVRLWNPAAERIFGWTRPEVLNRPLPEGFGSMERDFRALSPERWNSGGESPGVEETAWRNKRGAPVAVSVAIAPLRATGGEATALLALATDITERKRSEAERVKLEEQLQRAQKLESIGRLAGGVAHDFNNLLTVINGYSDLLLLSQSALEGGTRRAVEQVRYAGEKAATLTQQLLAFSRKQIARVKPLNVNQLISESTDMLQRLLGEDIRMTMELDPGLGQTLADSGQIHQVLVNMAVNARDAMPEGGTLAVATRNADVCEAEAATNPDATAGPYVVMSISDSGTGMDLETQAHIFEPFFTTKPGGLGTGLGLSTAYGIVTQSGGWIAVRTKPGEGSTFLVFLPRIRAAMAAESEVKPEPSPQGTETVLVVEDEAAVRALVAEVLRCSGYRVLTAESGEAALAVSARHDGPLDLLLTDLIMPGITGRELARRLQEARPPLKVLYVSGYAEDVIAHRGKLDGDVAFLAKPFAPEALLDKVREVIAQEVPR